MIVIVMGVSGVGKTTVGKALARELNARFVEGDDYHSPENVEKMRGGTPLNDHDRRPWLQTLNRKIGEWAAADAPVVLSCSALKKAYRDLLCAGQDSVRFVYLKAERAVVATRLGARKGHYMPATLLDSQYQGLEEPRGEANVLTVDGGRPVAEILADVLPQLRPPSR